MARTVTDRADWLRRARARFGGEPDLLLAVFSANAIGFFPLTTLPWLLGTLIRSGGYSNTASGVIATGVTGLLAATALFVGARINELPRRALALAGAVAAAVGAGTLVLPSPRSVVIVMLGVLGIGAGACSAAGNSLISCSSNPSRLASNVWLCQMIWQTCIWFITPLAVAQWQIHGLGIVIGVGIAVLFPLLGRMPTGTVDRKEQRVDGRHFSSKSTGVVLAMLFCAFIFWLRDAVIWSLAERRGLALSLTEYDLSVTFAGASLLGLIGPITANFLGLRLGRLLTVVFSLAITAAVTQVIASTASGLAFRTAFLLWTGASIFAWTYLTEAAASLDPTGRVVAVSGGLVFAAYTLGPLLGGVAVDYGGGLSLSSLVLTMSLSAVCAAFVAVRQLPSAVSR